MASTIKLNSVPENKLCFIQGVLTYSRLTQKIDGEELKKAQDRARAAGQIPTEKPYTTATISNAKVLHTSANGMTIFEQYIDEHLYKSKKNPSAGYHYTGINTGNTLPWIGTSNDNGKNVDQIRPEGELASGLNVILVMRTFRSKTTGNIGRTLDGVIVLGDVKYYQNNTQAESLMEYGITFNPAPPVAPATESETPQSNVTFDAPVQPQNSPFGQPSGQPSDYHNGFSSPGVNGIGYTPE